MDDVPIIYGYIYMKIRKGNMGKIIKIQKLKETVKRVIIRKGGIPRYLIYDIISDLIYLNLLKRKNNSTYEILENKCYKKIQQKNFVYI